MTREQADRLRAIVAEQMRAHDIVASDTLPSSSHYGRIVVKEAIVRAMAVNVAMAAFEMGASSHPMSGEPGAEVLSACTDLSAAAALLAADNPDFAPASAAIDEPHAVLTAMRNTGVM